jgi:hypothetical protein
VKKPSDPWAKFNRFWMEMGIVGAVVVFIVFQLGASSITTLIEGSMNPSMKGDAGRTVLAVAIKTLPFTAAMAWLVARIALGKVGGWQEYTLVLMGGILASYFLSVSLSGGAALVPFERMQGSGPLGFVFAALDSFFFAYGQAAFFQAIILGPIFGSWGARLQGKK